MTGTTSRDLTAFARPLPFDRFGFDAVVSAVATAAASGSGPGSGVGETSSRSSAARVVVAVGSSWRVVAGLLAPFGV
ncbi:MAG TPA: hypothetical protein VG406_24585 [Isosphaeraceae bacterium]|nr:hypothetical protein [Isosphaeraceae bacterium]